MKVDPNDPAYPSLVTGKKTGETKYTVAFWRIYAALVAVESPSTYSEKARQARLITDAGFAALNKDEK